MGSAAGQNGLALVRIDRVADALDAGLALTSGGLGIRLADPDAIRTAAKADRRMSRIRATASRRQDALPLAGRGPVLCRLSRHRMGRAGI